MHKILALFPIPINVLKTQKTTLISFLIKMYKKKHNWCRWQSVLILWVHIKTACVHLIHYYTCAMSNLDGARIITTLHIVRGHLSLGASVTTSVAALSEGYTNVSGGYAGTEGSSSQHGSSLTRARGLHWKISSTGVARGPFLTRPHRPRMNKPSRRYCKRKCLLITIFMRTIVYTHLLFTLYPVNFLSTSIQVYLLSLILNSSSYRW